MATITGTEIIRDVRFLSQDEDVNAYRNTDPEMLVWLNEATSALCSALPTESTVTEAIALVAGALQSIPAKAISLVNVLRNLGVGGSTPGNAITPTARSLLDIFVPDWQNAAQTAAIVHYIPDAKNPRAFHVYPPALNNTHIEAVMTVPPTPMAALTDVIKVNDIYAPALTNYVLFRLYSKDSDDASNANIAMSYHKAFTIAAGIGA